MQALKDQSKKGPNFTIAKKELGGALSSAALERNKTKEQLEEEKKISLSIRIKPLEIDNLSIERLRSKATELWDAIVKLETEKYDLEERQKRQDYDVSIDFIDKPWSLLELPSRSWSSLAVKLNLHSSWKNWRKGRSNSLGTRPSRRVSTRKPSLENTP